MPTSKKIAISGRTENQKDYISAIDQNIITFGLGVAGTGKSYIAVSKAVQSLKEKEVDRIVLIRPAVSVDEDLGALPGDLNEKLGPYMTPLMDALRAHMSPEEIIYNIEIGTIELAALGLLRGRTFTKCFLVLDEAQDTTTSQMFMVLTRLGQGTKLVVTGDPDQCDLPGGYEQSGLYEATNILDHEYHGISFITLGHKDVVRAQIVKTVISAYERNRKGPRLAEYVLNGNGHIQLERES